MAKKEKLEFVDEEVVIGTPAANVAFIGKEPWKPLVKVKAQGVSFTLPEDQEKPFYHERAGFLTRTFPHLYKVVKEKG